MRKTAITLLTALGLLPLHADISTPLQLFGQATATTEMVRQANAVFKQLHDEEFIDTLLIYSSATPADTLRSQTWYWAGEYFYSKLQYEQARQYGMKALPLLHNGADRTGEADCLNLLAICNIRLDNYVAAIDYARQCFLLDEASGDSDRMSMSLNSLAAIYIKARQPAEAEQYMLRGLKTAGANLPRKAILLGTASEMYNAMGDNNRALDYAEQAYNLEKELGRENKAMIRLAQKGAVLIDLHRYDEAEQALLTAIGFFREHGEQQSLGISCNKIGRALIEQHREAEAVAFFKEAADIFAAIGDKANEMHARKGLYETLWDTDPDSARRELERFNTLRDSLYQLNTAESLAKYNAEFGNHWFREESDKQRTAKKQAIAVGIAIALLLLLIAILLWWVMRRRQKRLANLNRLLNYNIDDMRERYKELSEKYDNAVLNQGSQDDDGGLSASDKEFLDKAVNIVNDHMLQGKVDAESLACDMNMSLFRLRQRMVAVTGETPQAFISTMRMRRACHLLATRPDLNINEVARMCAYNDAPNFTRAFKKTFGLTPTQYQEKKSTTNRQTETTT